MPSIKNFPEVWVKRVLQKLTNADKAPWLAGVQELDVPVLELAGGSASEKNIIHVPTTTFEPDVLINNTTYPIAVQAYSDDDVILSLDKYQTKVTTLSDDDIIGASYEKIDVVTASHVRAISKKKYAKAAHAIAPAADAALTPVITTTGELVGGRRKLVYADLVALKNKMNLNEDEDGIVLVLCTEHWNDLLLDRQNFGNQLVDYNAGKPAPVIAGFKLHKYIANPRYTVAGAKVPFGSVPGATDLQASFAFVETNVVKKTGLTKQYFAPANLDPENQTNRLNYRHYFLALPLTAAQSGAILSAQS